MRIASLVAVALSASACTGPTYDTRPPFVADPPAVYVAKVKTILIGQPPTADEIAAVTADPAALTGLIQQWMQRPEYGQKMQVFFELAFQQTQISEVNFVDINPPNGLGNANGLGPKLLVENARESLARSVVAMTAANRPLTDAFTTTQLLMTPALMQLYAFLDTHTADDAAKVSDAFARANPNLTITLEASKGPIPLAESIDPQSPNYMTFYNPEILTIKYPDSASCDKLDPITFRATSVNLFNVLYGAVPPHAGSNGVTCPIRGGTGKGLQLAPSDFTTWTPVTVRAPHAGEATARFWDLPALRATTELVLATPRVGFFTTPAFEANWPTNQSNQMRVTVNQALIVATGAAVDGNDATQPTTTPGLDAAHAAPGSACFGCHQLLDPTRAVLSSTYSWFYSPQTDPALTAQPGLFAFQGVIAPMHTVDDFARILASHPLVPSAWAQKLCYYANSAPCDPDDPEFQRIVADFAAGMQWNTLVAELLASPITTNASRTQTGTKNGEIIAVARRDHLCAALDHRLGFVDVCQLEVAHQVGKPSTIAQIVNGMPSDGYGRGAIAPVLPNQPTLFYRAGAENICVATSQLVVDATPDPQQPGAKAWSSAHANDAIAEMVPLVMGLVEPDPRAHAAQAALAQHYADATAMGATPTDALRSTFVVACLSPSFIGIGM